MEKILYECPQGCHRYRQSIPEIVEAANKHKEKLVSLKQIAEEQKFKISSLREEKNALIDSVDQLELKQKDDNAVIMKMTREMRELKIKVRDLRMDAVEKEEVINEQSEHVMNVKVMETQVNDLKDEIVKKDEEIDYLKHVIDKESNVKEVMSLSLEDELKISEEKSDDEKIKQENKALKTKTESLEAELKTVKERAAVRGDLFTKMNNLSESSGKNLEKLKQSIQSLRYDRQKCWYGIKCRRMFCNFTHSHLFRKRNRVNKLPENAAKPFIVISLTFCVINVVKYFKKRKITRITLLANTEKVRKGHNKSLTVKIVLLSLKIGLT